MATDAYDLIFKPTELSLGSNSTGDITLSQQQIRITIRTGTMSVKSINIESEALANYLATWYDPATPYTPEYPWSPATKRYVDQHDTIVSATAPSNPTEWMVWYDTTEDSLKAYNWTSWETEWTEMVVLSYWHSTWQEFIDAYNKNAIVYCKASSNSNPWSWVQWRMAFMAFVSINSTTLLPTEVEFQYYRSRSSHSTAATVLDEVYIYKLTSNWTWTVTQRDTAAKPIAWTWIWLTYNSSGMTISADTTVLATKTDLNSKQDTLVSWTNIKTINNESLLWSWNITISAPTYNAWPWIEINNNSISAKAWTGIVVWDWSTDYSAMRWPCPNWYHIPLHTEHQDLVNMWTALWFGTSSGIDFVTYFHTPTSCSRWSNWNNQWFSGVAISWSANKAPDWFYVLSAYADPAYPSENYVETDYMMWLYESFWHPIRAFKDVPVIPDSNWTTVYQWTWSAWIYYNSTLWLISVSSDWTNWITLKDKNEWATTVWNYWDALSAANVWNVYQRGNNYWFPRTWTITTSITQVDASSYWPWNYYSSSTFITTTPYRDSSENRNLRWWITWIVVHPNWITNTGVLSVNWQAWAVTINEFTPWGIATTGYVVTKTASGYEWAAPQWTTYNAGEWIAIWTMHSDMQWPAPDGFHVPSSDEWAALCEILTSTFSMASNATTMGTYLKMPAAGFRYWNDAAVYRVGEYGEYWSSTPYSHIAFSLFFNSSNLDTDKDDTRAFGLSLRCFKDEPVIPTSSWTTLYDWSSVATGAWVFYNATDGLISASWDGTTWYTIMDKNLWATTVYNQWDTLTDANCGNFYQWGNNYSFPHSWTVTTSSTKIDTSNYWPWNYYNSSTFITTTSNIHDWSSVRNDNLWWWVSQWTWIWDWNTIINTGVLSVNGQTGNVTVEEPIEYTAWNGISIWNLSISSRQWPCEEWFHVPSAADWQWVWNIMNAMNPLLVANWGPRKNYLHMPYAWGRDWNSLYGQGSTGAYWSSSKGTEYPSFSCMLLMSSNYFHLNDEDERSWWHSIRAFKNEYVAPDNTWTVVFGTLWNSWIFWNQTEWLITITNGTTGYTMMDKNIGATVVYNDGDTLSEANCGKYFQRWNNYWFPRTWNVTTSNTAVNTAWYGPSNPYSDDTFIVSHEDWSANDNWDLWWDITNSTTIINNVISNTGVLSVNGQTWDVIIDDNTKIFVVNEPALTSWWSISDIKPFKDICERLISNPKHIVYITNKRSIMPHELEYIGSVMQIISHSWQFLDENNWMFNFIYIWFPFAENKEFFKYYWDIQVADWTARVANITADKINFAPWNSWTAWQVLTKTSGNYEWKTPTEPTVVSGDAWVTYTITVSNSDPASWTASNIITLVP